MFVRRPSVAGTFYPSRPDEIKNLIEKCFIHKLGPGRLPEKLDQNRKIISIIVPHAGFIYSGPGAAHCYLALAEQPKPDTVIILGPNHTGWGTPISMMGTGAWETPLGKVPIDEELALELFNASEIIDMDEKAHRREHSIEVQLPFLQYIYDDFKIIPICMMYQDLETCKSVAAAIEKIIKDRNILLIASSDLTHQESQESAKRKDQMIIDSITNMDEETLQEVVATNRITTCGYGPMSVIIMVSKKLGARKAELLSYHTSGDIIGDYHAVVGYAAAIISK